MKNSTIILISIDGLRSDRVTPDTMPFLSRFALESLQFTNCYAQSSYSLASHASMFTGLYPSVHGASIPLQQGLHNVPTLATHLRRAGFKTAAWTHGPHLSPLWGLNKDFDKYEQEYNLGRNFENALSYLKRNQRGQNFLFIHGQDLHVRNLTAGTRAKKHTDHVSRQKDILKEIQESPTRKCSDTRTGSFLRSLYDDTVANIDLSLAWFIDNVQQLDCWERTLLIITAPHGESLGEQEIFFRHGHALTNNLLHVPLFIHSRQIQPRQVLTQVRVIDILPTIVQFVDLAAPRVQGASLLPLATKDGTDRALFSELNYPDKNVYALQRGYLKTIVTERGGEIVKSKTFDLNKNPEERVKKHNRLMQTIRSLFRREIKPSPDLNLQVQKNRQISQNLSPTHRGPHIVRQLAKVGK